MHICKMLGQRRNINQFGRVRILIGEIAIILLLSRYQGQLFIWNNSLNEVQSAVAAYHPTHIGFVCELSTATPDLNVILVGMILFVTK